MDQEDLKRKKDELILKIFWKSFQVIFVLGIPAFSATYFGLKLDGYYGTGRNITIGLLVLAFILSWVIIIRQYQRLNKEIKEIEKKIK